MSVTTKTYQQLLIESVPNRAIPFLRAITTNQQIRDIMAEAGYSEAAQAEGWRLLYHATGFTPKTVGSDADAAARQAIAELDEWDEPGFRRIHAALERHHPEQDAFVFAGLEASRGPTAVLGVARLLDRLDQLEKGSEQDQAAIRTLEQRKIDAAVRAHLRSLVVTAQAAKPIDPSVSTQTGIAQQQALQSLFEWYRDWSETARAIIQKRSHLILLGLTKPRSRKLTDLADTGSMTVPVAANPPAASPPAANPPTTNAIQASNGVSGADATGAAAEAS